MSHPAELLLAELDSTLSHVADTRRDDMLRQMTDLFIAGAGFYSAEQIAVFDAVVARLAVDADTPALIELASRLMAVECSPSATMARLSSDDDPAVSAPVLEKSPALTDADLVGIAKSKSQGHLLAIAGRERISDAVTDILVERGNPAVKRKVVANKGALISENGFARLIGDARADKELAGLVRARTDIPPELQPFLEMATA